MLKQHTFTLNYTSNVDVKNEIKLNRNTLNILKLFYRQLQDSIHDVSIDSYSRSLIEKYPSVGKFLPSKIVSTIKSTLSHNNRYILYVNDRTIILQFMTNSKCQHCHDYARMVKLWLNIITKYSNKHCSKILYIDIYLTNEKKVLPTKSQEIINPIHVNSAYTYGFCHATNHIVIYRKEEWFKVLIHETFHSFALDEKLIANKHLDDKIQTIFPLNSKIMVNESYCESWAIIWNSVFHSFLAQPNNVNLFLKSFKYIYSYECSFSYYQVTKILHHFGLKYNELYENKRKYMTYKEGTNVFSYYILKSNTIQNINDFLQLCGNDNNILLFNTTYDKYYHFIENTYKKFKYTDIEIKNKETVRTLRMSVFDFQ